MPGIADDLQLSGGMEGENEEVRSYTLQVSHDLSVRDSVAVKILILIAVAMD